MRGTLLTIAALFLVYIAYYLINYSNPDNPKNRIPKIHSALSLIEKKDKSAEPTDPEPVAMLSPPAQQAEKGNTYEKLFERIEAQEPDAIEESLVTLAQQKNGNLTDEQAGRIEQALIQSYQERLADQLDPYLREVEFAPPVIITALKIIVKEGSLNAINLLADKLRRSEQIRTLFYQSINSDTNLKPSRPVAEALLPIIIETQQTQDEVDPQALTTISKLLLSLGDENDSQTWVRNQLARENDLNPALRTALEAMLPKEKTEKASLANEPTE